VVYFFDRLLLDLGVLVWHLELNRLEVSGYLATLHLVLVEDTNLLGLYFMGHPSNFQIRKGKTTRLSCEITHIDVLKCVSTSHLTEIIDSLDGEARKNV
jgi:hypothetical protein